MTLVKNSLLKLALATCLLLLVACATPSAKEISQKTDVSLIDTIDCKMSIAELQTADLLKLNFDDDSTVKVDSDSKCIMSSGSPTYFAAYALPDFIEDGYALQVQSRVIKKQLVFLPDVYLLNSNLEVVSKTEGASFKYRQIKYEKTIFVNSDEDDLKYVLFTTNPEIVGDSEKRRLVSSVTSGTGYGGYIVTGQDSVNEIFYTTQGEITVLSIKN